MHCINENKMHDVVYDGLALRYTAAHGIGGGSVKRIAVRNCDISWIGGGYLYFDNFGNGVRYGNGIELWGSAEDVTVESNRVWECWDAGLTNQSNVDGALQKNISYLGNVVWNCEYSYEYWQQGAHAKTENIRVAGNSFSDAGRGWGHRQRWNPNAAHLMFYDTTAATTGFVVAGNVFSRSEDVLFRLFNDWRAKPDDARQRMAGRQGEHMPFPRTSYRKARLSLSRPARPDPRRQPRRNPVPGFGRARLRTGGA